jgi:hypothetical protein
MKLFYILTIAHLSYLSSISQINLVSNGGFEELSECPTSFQMIQNPGIELANTWWNCTNLDSTYTSTSDIFNTCFDSSLMQDARLYFIGNTTPYEENGFAGFSLYVEPTSLPNLVSFGEYLSCELNSGVLPSRTFLLSFHIKLSEVIANHNLKNLRVAFHSDSIISPGVITFQNNVNDAFPDYQDYDVFEITGLDSVPYDEWIKVETLINPTKTSSHMAIGAFKSNQSIFEDDEIVYSHDIIFPPLTAQSVYYLIDNISLTEIVDTTSIGNIIKAKIKIYPNPFNNFLTISGLTDGEYIINLFDVSGRLIYETKFNGEEEIHLSTSQIQPGIYFVEIISSSGKRILTDKLIK